MEDKAKYFPQTVAALQSLQKTAALLADTVQSSTRKSRQTADKLQDLRRQIAEKAARLDAVITKLSGAEK